MDKALSDLLDYCKSKNRIFPKDIYWDYLFDFLPPNTNGEKPPYPWEDYYDSLLDAETDQQKLFLQHVEWAYHNGVFERCDHFLRSLIEEDRWIHVGEYTGGHRPQGSDHSDCTAIGRPSRTGFGKGDRK